MIENLKILFNLTVLSFIVSIPLGWALERTTPSMNFEFVWEACLWGGSIAYYAIWFLLILIAWVLTPEFKPTRYR